MFQISLDDEHVAKKTVNSVLGINSCFLEKINKHGKKTERRILNVKRGGLQSNHIALRG